TISNPDLFNLDQNTIVKKLLPNLYNSIKEKENNYKELLPSLYNSIKEKENNCKKAITKPSRFY
ncbi:37195_t:CDS:1, partial [Gigaspora margarita]